MTDFDTWLGETFEEGSPAGFTVLIVLVRITRTAINPVASSFAHIIGTDMSWAEMARLLSGAGRKWDGVVFFPRRDKVHGGPLDAETAKLWRTEREAAIDRDRLAINDGWFFDAWGRRMQVEEEPQ